MVAVPVAPFMRDYQRDYTGGGTKEERIKGLASPLRPLFLFGFLGWARGSAATDGPVDLRSAANARSAAQGRESERPAADEKASRQAGDSIIGRGERI